MKIIVLCLLLGTAIGAPEKDLTIQEFEEKFHQKFADPKDEADAAEELAKREAEIDEQNEKFANGEANFDEELEPWDDLSEDEIIKEKTGLEEGEERFNPMRTGLLMKPEHERVNTPEERAFLDEIYAKYDRDSIPASWDSRAKGWVTVAKNQKSCGSCSAFAQIGMAETSLIKAGAKKEGMDLSEDWVINCRQDGSDVCDGAHISDYAQYMVKKGGLIHEKTSPYTTQKGSKTGPCVTKPYWSPGYKFVKTVVEWGPAGWGKNQGPTDEQIMMQVMEHGSSVIGVYAHGPVFSYKSGVLDTCSNEKGINHAVLAVGWGTENGIPYWIIKNSWGSWGQNGFGKIKRGTCGINSYGAVTLKAVKTTGVADDIPEDPTICKNKHEHSDGKAHERCVLWKNKGYCKGKYEAWMSKNCGQTCGLCTPKGGYCDVKHLFGEITGKWKLGMTGSDGTFRDADGLCDAGKCYVIGMANSCKAICGKDPCPHCKNSEKYAKSCAYWKSKGYCAKNTEFNNNPYISFMASNCGETCGFCPKKA